MVRTGEHAERRSALLAAGRCCRRGVVRAVVIAALVVLVASGSAGATAKKPWLWQCSGIGLQVAQDRCYERLLLETIDQAGSPATELPRIDQLAKHAGGAVYANCHMYMHVVGRAWAREHRLTLDRLQSVVPRSNDPGCSAGFGMGLVMALGPQIIDILPAAAEKPQVLAALRGAADIGILHSSRTILATSCPRLSRASTSSFAASKDVDGRDEPGHDDAY